jgi:hypothetical protein
VDPAVGTIFQIVSEYLDRRQKPLNRIITQLENRYRQLTRTAHDKPRATNRHVQQLTAIIIGLNHEPYRFFDSLLSLAEQGLLQDGSSLDDLRDALDLDKTDQLINNATKLLTTQSTLHTDTAEVKTCMCHDSTHSFGNINLDSHFKGASELMTVDVQGTVYLIPPQSAPRRLNHTASDIWRFLTNGMSLEAAIDKYSVLYSCPIIEASKELVPFLTEMLQSGFLHEVQGANDRC